MEDGHLSSPSPSGAPSPLILLDVLRPPEEPFPALLQTILSFIAVSAAKSAEARAAEVFFDALIASNVLHEEDIKRMKKESRNADVTISTKPPHMSYEVTSNMDKRRRAHSSASRTPSLSTPPTTLMASHLSSSETKAAPLHTSGLGSIPALRELLYPEVCLLVSIHYIRKTIRELESLRVRSGISTDQTSGQSLPYPSSTSSPSQSSFASADCSSRLAATPSCEDDHTLSCVDGVLNREQRAAACRGYEVLGNQLRWLYCLLPDPHISALWHMVTRVCEILRARHRLTGVKAQPPSESKKRSREEKSDNVSGANPAGSSDDDSLRTIFSASLPSWGENEVEMPLDQKQLWERAEARSAVSVVTESAMRTVEECIRRVIESIQVEVLQETHQLSRRATRIKIEYSLV